jgi:hypothetical protein
VWHRLGGFWLRSLQLSYRDSAAGTAANSTNGTARGCQLTRWHLGPPPTWACSRPARQGNPGQNVAQRCHQRQFRDKLALLSTRTVWRALPGCSSFMCACCRLSLRTRVSDD